jgi:hypothetical protein
MGQPICGNAMVFAIANRGIVDQSVEVTKPIDLGRQIPGPRYGLDVPDPDRLGLGQLLASRFGLTSGAAEHSLHPAQELELLVDGKSIRNARTHILLQLLMVAAVLCSICDLG